MGSLVRAQVEEQKADESQPLNYKVLFQYAPVVELVDTQDLKSCDGNVVRVQVPSGVPAKSSLSEMKGFFVLKRLRNNC
jgi:hypothetical protein